MLDYLETLLAFLFSQLQSFWVPLVFFNYFHFAILCKSINTELNTIIKSTYILYIVRLRKPN